MQSQVYVNAAIAVPGDVATSNQGVYYPLNLLAGTNGVTCGKFTFVDQYGLLNDEGTGELIGIAQRNLSYPGYQFENTLTIPSGCPVQVLTKGDVYVKAVATANRGDYVHVNGANITYNTTEAGSTGWKVVTGGITNDTILISK